MDRTRPMLRRPTTWVVVVGLAAAAFWIVAIGVGSRAWILVGGDVGIVAHVDAFGLRAAPWGIVAAILTLTAVVVWVGAVVEAGLRSPRDLASGSELDRAPADPSDT